MRKWLSKLLLSFPSSACWLPLSFSPPVNLILLMFRFERALLRVPPPTEDRTCQPPLTADITWVPLSIHIYTDMRDTDCDVYQTSAHVCLVQPPKAGEKYGSGTDSDYDNSQTYDVSYGWVLTLNYHKKQSTPDSASFCICLISFEICGERFTAFHLYCLKKLRQKYIAVVVLLYF